MADEEKKEKKSIWGSIGSVVFTILVLMWIFGDSDYDVDGGSEDVESYKQMGETVKTKYFNVKVHSKGTFVGTSIGSGYSKQTAEEGNIYVVVKATFENIDDEARMLAGAELEIEVNGKKLRFDDMASVMSDGYCYGIESINPMVTKTCKMAWLVPDKKGIKITFVPPRSSTGIYIGQYN